MSRACTRGRIIVRAGLAACAALGLSIGAALASGDAAPEGRPVTGAGDPARVIGVPGTGVVLKLWTGADAIGREAPQYSISLDGRTFSEPRATSYSVKLRAGEFDPLAEAAPAVVPALAAGDDTNLYVVQFVTPPLEEFRAAIRDLGGTVRSFIANHSHIVQMDAAAREAVENLPFVRWVGPYEPEYRLEPFLVENIDRAESVYPFARYNIMVFEPGLGQKTAVAARIEAIGGIVDRVHAGKFLLEATLTPAQLFQVARWDEVLYVDRWGPYEPDMNNSRELSGANYVETVAGYTGEGVRGEVFDAGFNLGHGDFASRPLILHGSVGTDSHGASTSGIVFGDGTGNPLARGVLPAAQGIVADYNTIGLEGPTRYDHTGELLDFPYQGVFQTSSVGSPRTFFYTTISADTDAALFDFDVLHCQSQSNAGNQDSRPQAWAKNILSGGGVYHYDTLTKDDDCWCGGGSTGPGQDGRIKPDLCHFYDDILTTTTGGAAAYTFNFGGTSGATPNICGYTGLFFQMWADGIFGNEVDPGGTVFSNRPHMTTAKAAMINTASQYPFSGASDDLTRVHQGWGMPDVKNLYDLREKMLIVNETDVLPPLSSVAYNFGVANDEPAFKATLVFADPPGNPAAAEARINNLDLRVTAPGGEVYWGNNGLLENMWSTPGGLPNEVDTVENVFLENPAPGTYVIEVMATEIIEDSHLETPQLDADFALVVSGGQLGPGYAISVDPPSQQICAPDDATYDIELVQFVEYVEPVTLTAIGAPPGATVTFTDNDLPPPATTQMIISDTDSATPGVYSIEIHGSSVDIERSTFVVLDLSTEIPGTATLLIPTDGETDVARKPTLTWSAATQGTSYDLQIATNPTFTNIVYSTTLPGTTHTVPNNLDTLTLHYWRVRAHNGCGVGPWSTPFTFTTLDQPDYFTEQFPSGNDLDGLMATYVPDGTGDYYDACVEPITDLPTNPVGGTVLSLSDDSSAPFNIIFPVYLYGVPYSTVYVGSNGYVTFGSGDSDYTETLEEHFSLPRIAGLYDDLNPSAGGSVSWRFLTDRVAVTWDGVPEYSTTNNNTFQIEMFFNGVIRIAWLTIAAPDGIVGLSQGNGLPDDYEASDVSASGPCNAPCPADFDGSGDVGFSDLLQMLGVWGPCGGCPEDLDGSGDVGFSDILALLGVWGSC